MRYLLLLTYPILVSFIMVLYTLYDAEDFVTANLRSALKETKEQLADTEKYIDQLEHRVKRIEERYNEIKK